MRIKTQAITPAKAAELLESNTSNRPLSRATVRENALRRADTGSDRGGGDYC